jgi:hypothetical protein
LCCRCRGLSLSRRRTQCWEKSAICTILFIGIVASSIVASSIVASSIVIIIPIPFILYFSKISVGKFSISKILLHYTRRVDCSSNN